MAKIVLIDDEVNMIWALEKALTKEGHQVVSAQDGLEGLQLIRNACPDLVLTDVKLPGLSGIQLLEELKGEFTALPVILLTGFASVEMAVEAMKIGAADFILKPFDIETVKISVRKALGLEKLKDELRFWREEASRLGTASGIIWRSPVMGEVIKLLQQVAPSAVTIIVTGETGTGKELVAQALHDLSPRREQAIVKVNCAALPENLMESELFGHEKGAFTGATSRKLGRFERADGGTIFLDEIGEMPSAMQAKLLRVLQEKEIERIGGINTIKVDVRIIAATNRDLQEEVKAGRFREDLYYRLNVVRIHMPALRERKEDIPELVNYFMSRFSKELNKNGLEIAPETLDYLINYDWPGNIRELQNVIERAVILCQEPFLVPDLLPIEVLSAKITNESVNLATNSQFAATLPEEGIDLEQIEQDLIKQALARASGNQTQAAKLLGITRYTLIYRMEKYGMKPAK